MMTIENRPKHHSMPLQIALAVVMMIAPADETRDASVAGAAASTTDTDVLIVSPGVAVECIGGTSWIILAVS